MTCKDCIHHDLCFDNGTLFLNYAKGKVKENAEIYCPFKHFKNKADYEEVKHGRWKGAGLGDYECTACWEVYSGGNRFKRCPNCGAKNN